MELIRLAQSSRRQRRRQGQTRAEVTRSAVVCVESDGSDVATTAAALAPAPVPHGLSTAALEAARSQRRLLNLEAAIRVAEQIQEAEQQRRHQQQQQPAGDSRGLTSAAAGQIGNAKHGHGHGHEHGQPAQGNSIGERGRASATQQEDPGSEEMTDALLNLLEELSVSL